MHLGGGGGGVERGEPHPDRFLQTEPDGQCHRQCHQYRPTDSDTQCHLSIRYRPRTSSDIDIRGVEITERQLNLSGLFQTFFVSLQED